MADIAQLARDNSTFRTVVKTTEHMQVVLMSLLPGEDIGSEVHHLDQALVIVDGHGEAVLDGQTQAVSPGHMVVVPAGTEHNIINSNEGAMKLYTIYAPPDHRDGTIHRTKADALADESDHP